MDAGNGKCHGTMPCSNYREGYSENFFVPDDYLLREEFGCKACANRYDETMCSECSRNYDDLWERQGEEEP